MKAKFENYSKALAFVNETFKNNVGIEESYEKRENAEFIVKRMATSFINEEDVNDMFIVVDKKGHIVGEIGYKNFN
jgi:hypothetical protein